MVRLVSVTLRTEFLVECCCWLLFRLSFRRGPTPFGIQFSNARENSEDCDKTAMWKPMLTNAVNPAAPSRRVRMDFVVSICVDEERQPKSSNRPER
jgi:hypothetical protein